MNVGGKVKRSGGASSQEGYAVDAENTRVETACEPGQVPVTEQLTNWLVLQPYQKNQPPCDNLSLRMAENTVASVVIKEFWPMLVDAHEHREAATAVYQSHRYRCLAVLVSYR
ncbi:hypothetical protein ACTUVN_004107 [Pseudomonas caspiana]